MPRNRFPGDKDSETVMKKLNFSALWSSGLSGPPGAAQTQYGKEAR
jgi:hypothetical protein